MSRTLNNVGLVGDFDEGSNNWANDMNANLLKLSTLVQASVDSFAAAVPGSPASGATVVLTAAPNKDKIAVYDEGAWSYLTPQSGWEVYDRGANKKMRFTAGAWTEVTSGGSSGGSGGSSGGYGTHRYYRLNVLKRSDNGMPVLISEVKFYGSDNSVINYATAAASSYLSNDNQYAPNNVRDGNINNIWASGGSDASPWLSFDFGVPVSPRKIGVTIGGDTGWPSQGPASGTWQYSDDNVTWTDATPMVFGAFTYQVEQVVTIPGAASGTSSVPAGGSTGQVLAKKSATDGDTEWKTVSGGGGASEWTSLTFGAVGAGPYNNWFPSNEDINCTLGAVFEFEVVINRVGSEDIGFILTPDGVNGVEVVLQSDLNLVFYRVYSGGRTVLDAKGGDGRRGYPGGHVFYALLCVGAGSGSANNLTLKWNNAEVSNARVNESDVPFAGVHKLARAVGAASSSALAARYRKVA